jgi:hypothetical protein
MSRARRTITDIAARQTQREAAARRADDIINEIDRANDRPEAQRLRSELKLIVREINRLDVALRRCKGRAAA